MIRKEYTQQKEKTIKQTGLFIVMSGAQFVDLY